MRWLLGGLLVVVAVLLAQSRAELRDTAPDELKRRCAREPVDVLDKHQYTNCLARGGPRPKT